MGSLQELFNGNAGAIVSIAAAIVCWQLKRLIDSVDTLNSNVAAVIARVDGHETRISHLEEKV